MNEGKFKEKSVGRYPSEAKKLFADSLVSKFGITLDQLRKLSEQERKKFLKETREIAKKPGIREVINQKSTTQKSSLTAKQAQKIRGILGLEKWQDLSEMVSYVKTIVGEKETEKKSEKYKDHLAFGIDSNELKETLSEINDVLPARIDTDIKHQSTRYYRAVVEVVSNAIDASIPDKNPIGRFGIGFYQILNHLKEPSDRVIVKTKTINDKEGVKLEFRNNQGKIDFRILPDKSINNQGTVVELKSDNFKAENGEEIVREYFHNSQSADIKINGERMDRWIPDNKTNQRELPTLDTKIEDGSFVVKDGGRGMSIETIFEKLLVPKLSNKPPVYELREKGELSSHLYYEIPKENETIDECEIVVQVGDIKVETFKAKGSNIAKKLVIDLPSSTILGEQRDEINVDHHTVSSIKKLIKEDVLGLDQSDRFKVINALGTVCQEIQNRSQLPEQEDNVFSYLQDQVRNNHEDISFVPNHQEFSELELDEDKTVLLDPQICQSSPKTVPELKEVEQWESRTNTPLFLAKFKEGSRQSFIVDESFIIVDESVKPLENREIFNKAMAMATHLEKGKIPEKDYSRKRIENKGEKFYDNLESLSQDRYQEFYFGSPEIAIRQARELQSKKPLIVKEFLSILSQTPNGLSMEIWNLMESYVKSERNQEDQIEDVKYLKDNLTPLLNNPKTREVLNNNFVPIISMFDPVLAGLPKNLRDNWDKLKGKTTVDGKEFFVFDSGRRESTKTLLSPDGEAVYFYRDRDEDIIFKNKDIIVYKNRIVNTQTGKSIPLPAGSQSSWGKLYFDFSPSELDVEEIDPVTRQKPKEKIRDQESQSSKAEDNEGNVYEIKYGKLCINGKEKEEFGEIITSGPKKPDNVRLNFKRILKTNSGEVLILAHNVSDWIIEDYEDEEKLYLLNDRGETIWKLDDKKWGEKLNFDNFETDDRFKDKHKNVPRCILFSDNKIIGKNEPIIKIVRYNFRRHGGRVREVIGYVDATGKEFSIDESPHINKVTLEAKYAWEGDCHCCGARGQGFEFGSNSYSPFDEKGESTLKNFVKLPVTIESGFKFQPETKEWTALARGEDGEYLAIFNEKGNFLRAEKIGRMIGNGDYRDLKLYYLHRMPNDIEKTENPRDQIDAKEKIMLTESGYGYSKSLSPKLKERNIFKDGILDRSKNTLNPEHASLLGDFLSKYPVPDQKNLERLFYRTLQFKELSPEDMKFMLPIFYNLEELDEKIVSEPVIKHLRKISNLDQEKFIKFVSILDKILPEKEDKMELAVQKFNKFFFEKLQNESLNEIKKIFSDLAWVKEYSNSIVSDGFSLIKYQNQVPLHEIPRSIRPFVIFMQKTEEELATLESKKTERVGFSTPSLKLSQIIQWKRLRETQARNFSGKPEDLNELVSETTKEKTQEHILREITHAIHFQSLNSTDLYLRELVQNATDVMKAEKLPEKERKVKLEVSIDKDNNLKTEFTDPVGMNINSFINYFLVPGESTKLDKKYIGFYGQGIYTLFDKCQEIVIKTGRGNGKTWYAKMKPIIEHDMVVDVDIKLSRTNDIYKGTSISKVQKSENPYVEAAYIRNSLMTLTNALDSKKCSIILQGEQINASYPKLHQEAVDGLGELTVYKNPNNIVTKDGLFVKEIKSEYTELIPSFMNKSLHDWGGITIDLFPGLELTRSRQDVANKEETNKTLNPLIQRGLVNSYLRSFVEEFKKDYHVFPFKELPYDYFVNENYSIESKYIQDAKSLMEGKPLNHLDDYHSKSDAVKFMTILPIFEIGDGDNKVSMSLNDLRNARLEKKYPFDQDDWQNLVPGKIREIIAEQEEKFRESRPQKENSEDKEKLKIQDTKLTDILQNPPQELKEWLNKNKGQLILLDKLTREFIETLNPAYHPNRSVPNYFYYDENNSSAHATRFIPTMSWNLQSIKTSSWRNPIEEINGYQKEGPDILKLFESLKVLAHEYSHTIEETGQWSHDPNQEREQARILMQFLIHNGVNRLTNLLNKN
jgi:hypothetical protein